jgi:hypothetical protein
MSNICLEAPATWRTSICWERVSSTTVWRRQWSFDPKREHCRMSDMSTSQKGPNAKQKCQECPGTIGRNGGAGECPNTAWALVLSMLRWCRRSRYHYEAPWWPILASGGVAELQLACPGPGRLYVDPVTMDLSRRKWIFHHQGSFVWRHWRTLWFGHLLLLAVLPKGTAARPSEARANTTSAMPRNFRFITPKPPRCFNYLGVTPLVSP